MAAAHTGAKAHPVAPRRCGLNGGGGNSEPGVATSGPACCSDSEPLAAGEITCRITLDCSTAPASPPLPLACGMGPGACGD